MSDSPREPSATRKQDPLHGVTLETLLEHLSDTLGWDVLATSDELGGLGDGRLQRVGVLWHPVHGTSLNARAAK